MDKQECFYWKHNKVTEHFFKLLNEAKGHVIKELLELGPNREFFDRHYFYLQGKLSGIDLALEAELYNEEEQP